MTESLNISLRQAFIRLIADYTGLEIKEHDQTALSEKIFSRMKALKLSNPEHYYQHLESRTVKSYQEWENFIPLITNLESFFFRDSGQFKLLRNHIFSELIQRRADERTIRICSAGCSTGEEPYSLAILLKELIPNLEQWDLTILGIDINSEALKKARAGIYRPWSLRGIDANIKQIYFQLINGEYHIDPQIRQMVKFQSLNLVEDSFPQSASEFRNMDLILCRNVFIYFNTSTIKKVLDQFYQALRPGGILLTGHAELYGQHLGQFQTKVFPESIVHQRPIDFLINSSLAPSAFQPNPSLAAESLAEKCLPEGDDPNLENFLEKNTIKMQQTALNLLKQLPPNTKLSKLDNLTAAELIQQLEQTLQAIAQDAP